MVFKSGNFARKFVSFDVLDLSKKNSTFPKNIPKYLLMKELESYCGTINDTIYAYVEDYHTCSGIFS